MFNIVHLSSVHSTFDPRIFYKECKSLASNGYNVTLITPFDKNDKIKIEGVSIFPVNKPKNRIDRILSTVNQIRNVAFSLDADLYHFHDPELIIVGLLLRSKGKKVIYDIHEDYLTSIQQKRYLSIFRFPISWIFFLLEKISSNFFYLILAEKYYLNHYPKGTVIGNYPPLSRINKNNGKHDNGKQYNGSINLIYTGNITEDRGALIHASIVKSIDNIELYLIGRCSTAVATSIRKVAGTSVNKINIIGENSYVNYDEILEYYRSCNWTAALAIFPPTRHYKQKELTKVFEYMAFGIPIICSNFPVWKKLVEDNGVGLSVDPQDENSIVEAINYLDKNPNEAKEMGNQGIKLVQNQYNWESESQKLISLYKSILENNE